ncbi:hypothetical protein [Nonomuraea endophytica]|uniref:hypothetical protein n=1 Tax=Nonomuraea endophytica TaxID=714136 RepID=UPI0037C50E6F
MSGVTIPVALTGSDQAVHLGAAQLAGYTLRETGGVAAATARIFDHPSAASGTLLAVVALPAGGSADVMYCRPVRASAGIYVDVGGTGALEGSVRIA